MENFVFLYSAYSYVVSIHILKVFETVKNSLKILNFHRQCQLTNK